MPVRKSVSTAEKIVMPFAIVKPPGFDSFVIKKRLFTSNSHTISRAVVEKLTSRTEMSHKNRILNLTRKTLTLSPRCSIMKSVKFTD